MGKIETRRPYKNRLIDTYERSRVLQEVLRARKGRVGVLRKRYATMLLGASLAVGSVGVPLTAGRGFLRHAEEPRGGGGTISRTVPDDIAAAQKIAREVTGGVTGAAETIAAPFVDLEKKAFHLLTEKTKEEFFRTEVPFGPLIYKEAKRQDLDPTLVAAVVETESQFKSRARSGANAQGLMQLVPRTGRWMGAKNLMDPVQNVKAGTKYLKYLNERFDGDQEMVLAAYNAGEGNVRRFGGIPPFNETRNYVRKVLDSQEDYEQRVSGKVAESLEKITDRGAETR